MATVRDRINTGFEVFGRWIYRNRIKTLVLVLAFAGGLMSQLPKITTDTTNESYFHRDDPALADYKDFQEQFGREEVMVIAATPPEVFDRAFLGRLRAFHEALEERVPYLKKVTSLINARDTRGEGNELIVEDLLKNPPESPEDLARLRERVMGSSLYRNLLISEDGRLTTVFVETLAFSPGSMEPDLQAGFSDSGDAPNVAADRIAEPLTVRENREAVRAVKAIMAEFQSPDFPLHLSGGPVFDELFERIMQKDMSTFLGLAVLTIGILLFVLFRRVSGVLLSLAVVMLSLLSTVGLMAASGVPFTIPTTILPSFLLAVGVGASVHLLALFFHEYRRHGDKEQGISFALGHSGLPIVMTGLTTAAGLFSFATAEMAPVAQLGVFSGIGVLISLVYTLVLVPALLAILPLRQRPVLAGERQGAGFDRLLAGIADFATSRATSIVAVGAVVIVAAFAGLWPLRFSENFLRWLPSSLDLRQSSELIDRRLGGATPLEIVIDTGRENGLYEPAVLNRLDALDSFAGSYRDGNGGRLVAKTGSVNDVLKETNRALNENREAFYALPQERKLIAQELLLFENSGSDDLEDVVDSQFSKARLALRVPNANFETYIGFVEDIRREANRLYGQDAQITVTGSLNLFTQIMHRMMGSMAESYVIAGVVITLVMILLIGSFWLGLLSMVVNFFPILVTLGLVMGFSGIPLDTMTLLIGSIALGLAVDDTIHFFHNFRRYYGVRQDVRYAVRETMLTSGRAMLFTTLVLVAGFWLFMFATLNNVSMFGLLTGVTLILALAADILLAPALLTLVTRSPAGVRLCERWCCATGPVGAD